MDNIGAGEENKRVPVGMGMGDMQHLDFLAVEVDGEGIVEGDHRQGCGRSRGSALLAHQPGTDIVVGDDRSFDAEHLVAAGVVAVKMGIEEEFELAFAETLKLGADLVGQRGEFVVDHQEAVRTGRDTDIAALTADHVDRSGDRGNLKVLGGGGQGRKQHRKDQ